MVENARERETPTFGDEWKSIDRWEIGSGDGAVTADISMVASLGLFRFKATTPEGETEETDLTRLYRRVALRANASGGGVESAVEAVDRFQAFGADDKSHGLYTTNAMAALGLVGADVGFRARKGKVEASLERQTEGSVRRGWIHARVDGVQIRFLVFADASAVAVVKEKNGMSQALPLVVDLTGPFRTKPGKVYRATLGMNKVSQGPDDASIIYGPKESRRFISLPVEVQSLPEPLAKDILEVAQRMLAARRAFDDLPPLRKPDPADLDAGAITRVDRRGLWETASGVVFYWPVFLAHRSVALDAFEAYRDVVEGYAQMMLWADSGITSPVTVKLKTISGTKLWEGPVDIQYRRQFSGFVSAVEKKIADAIPGLTEAIGFEAKPAGKSANISRYDLMRVDVSRPSAAREQALEARFGAIFSDQAGYKSPVPEDDMEARASKIGAVFDLMTGLVLGHPGVPVVTDHDVLVPMVDDDNEIHATPMWITLAGGVKAIRFERVVAQWPGPQARRYFDRPRMAGRKWGFSLLLSEQDDPRCEAPLGFISLEAELSPPTTPLKHKKVPEAEIYRLKVAVVGWAVSGQDGVSEERVFLGLMSGLLESLKLELLGLQDACSASRGRVFVDVVVQSDSTVRGGSRARALMTRSLEIIRDEMRDEQGASARMKLLVKDGGEILSEMIADPESSGLCAVPDGGPGTNAAEPTAAPFVDGLCGAVVSLPPGRVESAYPRGFSDLFVEMLQARLLDYGVLPEDLAPRVLDVWDPASDLDEMVQWIPREDLSRDRLVELQADFVTGQEGLQSYALRLGGMNSLSGSRIASATNQMELLGAWVMSALDVIGRAHDFSSTRVESGILPPPSRRSEKVGWHEAHGVFEVPARERRGRGFNYLECLKLAQEMAPGEEDTSRSSLSIRGQGGRKSYDALPSPEMIGFKGWAGMMGTTPTSHEEVVPLIEYLAGTLALNARTHSVVRLRVHNEPHSPAIKEAVEALIARRDAPTVAGGEEDTAGPSSLEKRHHMLGLKWQEVFSPGEVQTEDITDEQLLALVAHVPKRPLSVFLGVSTRTLADRVRAARRRVFNEDVTSPNIRRRSLFSLSAEELSAAAARISPEAMAKLFGVSRPVVENAIKKADRQIFDVSVVPSSCHALLRAADGD